VIMFLSYCSSGTLCMVYPQGGRLIFFIMSFHRINEAINLISDPPIGYGKD
jgi:hypothetical protein